MCRGKNHYKEKLYVQYLHCLVNKQNFSFQYLPLEIKILQLHHFFSLSDALVQCNIGYTCNILASTFFLHLKKMTYPICFKSISKADFSITLHKSASKQIEYSLRRSERSRLIWFGSNTTKLAPAHLKYTIAEQQSVHSRKHIYTYRNAELFIYIYIYTNLSSEEKLILKSRFYHRAAARQSRELASCDGRSSRASSVYIAFRGFSLLHSSTRAIIELYEKLMGVGEESKKKKKKIGSF